MKKAFRALLIEGLRHFSQRGYRSEAELQEWIMRLHAALEREVPSDDESKQMLGRVLGRVFERDLKSGIAKRVPGVSRYTLDRVAPNLRAELDRRIFAGADLIRLRKREAIDTTLARFSGWASSVPPAGTFDFSERAQSKRIAKDITQLKFEWRRLAIDQGHKLSAAVTHTVAMGEGAIGGVWHDRGEDDPNYDADPHHLARSGKWFLLRESWAMEQGLIRRGSAPYYDDIDAVAQRPYCSCWMTWETSPGGLPSEMLTAKGRAWVSGVRLDSVPTPAQIEAGNYPKGHIRLHGMDISIETVRGATRGGVGPDGRSWSVTMPADYGYIRRTIGADDEQIDCYIGPNPDASTVWVVDQHDADTHAFDEQKVLIGFNARSQALAAYESGFSDGRGRLRIGGIHELPVEDFVRQVRAELTIPQCIRFPLRISSARFAPDFK